MNPVVENGIKRETKDNIMIKLNFLNIINNSKRKHALLEQCHFSLTG